MVDFFEIDQAEEQKKMNKKNLSELNLPPPPRRKFLDPRMHCVVSLSKTLYPLLSPGSTQEDPSRHDEKNVDWGVKNQI